VENDPFPRFFKKTAIFGGKTPVLMDFSKNRGEYQTRSKRTFAHCLGIRVSCETTQNTCFLGWFSAKTRNIDIQNLQYRSSFNFLYFKNLCTWINFYRISCTNVQVCANVHVQCVVYTCSPYDYNQARSEHEFSSLSNILVFIRSLCTKTTF